MVQNASGPVIPARQATLPLIWPRLRADDPEPMRRKKLGVRGLNGVLAGMVSVLMLAVSVELVRHQLWPKLGLFLAGCVLYLSWALRGMAPIMEQVLRSDETARPPRWPAQAWPGTWIFLGVELLLGTAAIYAALPVNPGGVLRILLLPVLAHAVICLRWPGITFISIACAGVYAVALTQQVAGGGPIGFFLEGAFTIVCMHMVVSAQKGRAEVERMAAELASANRTLSVYAAQAEELAASRERNRLAREIHDSLGHYLTVVRVQLEAAMALHDRGSEQAMESVRKAQAFVGEGLQEIRNSIAALRAAPLESRTLCEALLALVSECESTGMSVKMEVNGTERELSAPASLTLYRTAQEGLTNVRKHASGVKAQLKIDFRPQGVCLGVSDAGPGATSITGGFGLLGLRERAALLGGKLVTRTAPGEGFTLEIELPE